MTRSQQGIGERKNESDPDDPGYKRRSSCAVCVCRQVRLKGVCCDRDEDEVVDHEHRDARHAKDALGVHAE
eukprot:CAMPEP_0181190726 /NCGR_PEP_ID=MMETSP1096-20121128/12347_1 /TAXON_ID=156174 ORGANISM="Chrysochromulina ericina, Strain CCMP281" /NCGR_SAMPLE_ID=MMETSP1096 /ASSEMBLY_ACC=CAM_ASM_000453 /LENGTH=70 /DNA_ID=CAMNT_0023279961 /DNA_START=214 /DNA_END=426 /DNA_ORIENTATION=+